MLVLLFLALHGRVDKGVGHILLPLKLLSLAHSVLIVVVARQDLPIDFIHLSNRPHRVLQ